MTRPWCPTSHMDKLNGEQRGPSMFSGPFSHDDGEDGDDEGDNDGDGNDEAKRQAKGAVYVFRFLFS